MNMTEHVQEKGFNVAHYAHDSLATGHADHEAANIKKGRYACVWCQFPIAHRHVKQDKMTRAMTTICTWAALASASQTPFVLAGLYGSKWTDGQVTALVNDGTLTTAQHDFAGWASRLTLARCSP